MARTRQSKQREAKTPSIRFLIEKKNKNSKTAKNNSETIFIHGETVLSKYKAKDLPTSPFN